MAEGRRQNGYKPTELEVLFFFFPCDRLTLKLLRLEGIIIFHGTDECQEITYHFRNHVSLSVVVVQNSGILGIKCIFKFFVLIQIYTQIAKRVKIVLHIPHPSPICYFSTNLHNHNRILQTKLSVINASGSTMEYHIFVLLLSILVSSICDIFSSFVFHGLTFLISTQVLK